MPDVLLGLDVGTTNIKAVAITPPGELVAQAARHTPSYFPEPGQEEHNPDELWQTVRGTIQDMTAKLPAGTKILGMAIASMAEEGVPLSETGDVLYPFIVWHDKRTRPQWQWWEEHVGAAEVYRRTGLFLHPMYSVMKLMWLAQNHPAAFAAARRFLCVEDFVIWHLTGQQATSYSIASRTMAFNLATHSWDETILAKAGIPLDMFPRAHPSGTVVGAVNGAAATETGLSEGIPVAIGGHDHLCAALAAGAVDPQTALDSSGTTETLIVTLTQPHLDEGMMDAGYGQGCHVLADQYALNAGVPMGGAALEWLAGLLKISIEHLVNEARQAPSGSGGLYFLPHLRGSGTPNRDPNSVGMFFGLSDASERSHIARAALEGVCYEIALNFQHLKRLAGIELSRLRVVGGGSRSPFWNQLKADITGLPVEVPKVNEATACGAALLAGLGVGVYKDWQEIAALVPLQATYEPDQKQHTNYTDRLEQVYSKLYLAVKGIKG